MLGRVNFQQKEHVQSLRIQANLSEGEKLQNSFDILIENRHWNAAGENESEREIHNELWKFWKRFDT